MFRMICYFVFEMGCIDSCELFIRIILVRCGLVLVLFSVMVVLIYVIVFRLMYFYFGLLVVLLGWVGVIIL